ncbi:MAG: hypothetical protein KBF32_14300, partial [Chitinophagales bacterium]|nr:hypothetical protein [Chitinophagales bacterium]
MKKASGIVLICFSIGLSCTVAKAQESLLPLHYNAAQFSLKQQSTVRSAVTLPFVDDFSYSGPEPDVLLWENNGAFINLTFPKDPVSYGVATLDGLDGNGIPYDTSSYSFSTIGPADTLTSMPVLMAGLSAADSVYFSFYYQPGGLGDVPNNQTFNLFNYGVNFGDSLVLEFKDNTGSWHSAWQQDG